jgi:hypothetical protein
MTTDEILNVVFRAGLVITERLQAGDRPPIPLRSPATKALLFALLLPTLTGCGSYAPFAMTQTLMGGSPLTQMDSARYKRITPLAPGEQPRNDYFECLHETAGQGRDPFDACMLARGWAR